MKIGVRNFFLLILCLSFFAAVATSQSRRSAKGDSVEGTVLTVTASRDDKKADPIKPADLNLYENGIEQKIKNFALDPSPSKIVILVDNSQTLPISVYNYVQYSLDPAIAAVSTMLMAVSVLALFLASRLLPMERLGR